MLHCSQDAWWSCRILRDLIAANNVVSITTDPLLDNGGGLWTLSLISRGVSELSNVVGEFSGSSAYS